MENREITKTKKAKKIVYLSKEKSLVLKEKLEKEIEDLVIQKQDVQQKYVDEGKVLQKKKMRGVKKLERLARHIRHIDTLIQKKKIEINHCEDGTYIQLNFFQKMLNSYKSLSYAHQKMVCGIVLLIPWFIGFVTFFLKPLLTTLVWSLFEVTPNAGSLSYVFVGFQNFINLFTTQMLGSKTFLEVLTVSIQSMIIDVPVIFIFSLLVAVVLNTKFKGHQVFKAIFFIPVVYNATAISAAIDGAFGGHMSSSMSAMTSILTSFSNYLLGLGLGEGLITFLINAVDRIFTIVNKSGIQILIFIAALQSIPKQLYEAAKVEGATTYECFWKITFPMVSNMFLPIIIYTIVDSFATSDLISFMTTNSAGSKIGYGMQSTIAIIYFAVNLLIIGILYLVLRKAVYNNDGRS